jgi:hypothetical protein
LVASKIKEVEVMKKENEVEIVLLAFEIKKGSRNSDSNICNQTKTC